VLRGGQPVRVPVKTGVTDASFTEVEGDLAPGDAVIVDSTDAPAPSPGGGSPGGGMRRVL
jgi:hypothetical protein